MLYAKICNKYLPKNQNNPAKDGRSTENKGDCARKEEKYKFAAKFPLRRITMIVARNSVNYPYFKGVSNPRTRNILSLLAFEHAQRAKQAGSLVPRPSITHRVR